MPFWECGICKELFKQDSGCRVACDASCGALFHYKCVFKTPESVPAPGVNTLWFCTKCRWDSAKIPKIRREPALEASIHALTARVDKIEENVDQLLEQREESDGANVTSPSCKEESFAKIERDGLLKLPRKVFGKVMHYLSVDDLLNLRLINQRWKKVVDNNSSFVDSVKAKFTGDIDLHFDPESLPPIAKASFDKADIFGIGSWWSTLLGESLTQLTLTKTCRVSVGTLLKMLQQTPNLNFLNLVCGSTMAFDNSLSDLSNFRLERMEILVLHLAPKQEGFLPLFGKIFPRLKDFRLPSKYEMCIEVDDILQKLKDTLESITLNSTARVFTYLDDHKRLKRLRLTINKCKIWGKLQEWLLSFSQWHPFLEVFHLEIVGDQDDSGCLIETEELELSTETLSQVIKNLPYLKSLSFRHIGDLADQLEAIDFLELNLNRLAQLEFLSIQGVGKGDSLRQMLSFNVVEILQLTELHLHQLTTDDTMHAFFATARNLRTIVLDQCTINKWSDLFVPGPSQKWHRLKLSSVKVTEEEINDFVYGYFKELCDLEIKYCEMPKKIMLMLFRLCLRVEKLRIYDLDDFDDDVALMMRRKMERLSDLFLYSKKFRDSTAEIIINNGPKLRQLTIFQATAYSMPCELEALLESITTGRCRISRWEKNCQSTK